MKLLKFSRSNRLKKTRKDFTPRQIVQSYCKQKDDEFGKDVMATWSLAMILFVILGINIVTLR